MATEVDIEVVEDNDPDVLFTCKVDGAARDLTGGDIDFWIKATKAIEEDDPSVVHYTSGDSEITPLPQSGGTLGQVRVTIRRADIPTPGKFRYRFDVTVADKRLTHAFGRLIIRDV